MAKEVRYLRQVGAQLESRYGAQKAQSILKKARTRYAQIVAENSDEPKEYYMHTRERIYPSIAVFDALLDAGVKRHEAADFVVEYYRWRASGLAPKIKAIFKIPLLYKVVPKFFYNMTMKSFGARAGFSSEDSHLAKDEMRFNITKCPYNDACTRYGCPEIVRGFCDADDICYGEMHPKLTWERTGTIGRGDEVCDFKIRVLG